MFFDTGDLYSDEIFLRLDETIEAIPEKGWAPAYCFTICLVKGSTEVGACNFRVGNTEKLFFAGNIGYEVYEPYRGSHYAGKACILLYKLARRHGMQYLIITCNPDNYASRKTCEYAGGSFLAVIDLPEDNGMFFENGETHKCIYRVDLLEPEKTSVNAYTVKANHRRCHC